MGLFDQFRTGLQKTQDKLVRELRRIVALSPELTEETLEELEAALISADFGMPVAQEIVQAARKSYETEGSNGSDIFGVAIDQIEKSLSHLKPGLIENPRGTTVVSLVGVNGTGKTTTAAKLAWRVQSRGEIVLLAACDTFRAAAIEQLKLWGERLDVPVIAGNYGADPSAVAHDAISAAISRKANYLFVDTAGRLHTKHNLMQELQKLHRVMGKQLDGAPHETLLVLDATTGMNALNQAREFHKAVPLTGLVVTKLDGTSKGGMVVAIQKELRLPVKFIGIGEKPDSLQPFDPRTFAEALFSGKES
jgi:fused signal recognition particle receptor